MSAYTPQQTFELVGRAGAYKGVMRLDKVFLSSVMAGMLLSFACATLITANTAPWFQMHAPGLLRVIAAIFFPYGLSMIVLSGTDLSTGSFMYTTVAVLQRRLSVVNMLIHWVVTFLGNLAGSLFIVAIIVGYGGVFDKSPYKDEVVSFADTKQLVPWHWVFLRGIGANWLVCMACFLGLSGRDYASKLLGIWFPTFAFVSLGFDHVVANMFFVPAGLWQGAHFTVGHYIGSGMVPACIGNIVGGAVFVGMWYYYLHMLNEPPILIDGQEFVPKYIASSSSSERGGSVSHGFGSKIISFGKKKQVDPENVPVANGGEGQKTS